MKTPAFESPTGTSEILSEDQFIDRFAPERADDGSVYVQRYSFSGRERQLIEQAQAERRLWTYVDDGAGNAAPVQGYHVVNREFYIICDVPYGDDESIEVLGDVDYCTICGERFAEYAHPADREVVVRSAVDPTLCDDCALQSRNA